MKFPLYTRVALAVDLPEEGLRTGDVVTPVEYYEAPGKESGYEVEAFNALGHTIAVVTVFESQLQALRNDEILSVRHRVPVAA